jgi:WD40 repeat protein
MASWIRKLRKMPSGWSTVLQTLEGHDGGVGDIAFSPDSKLLASASDDFTVGLVR